MNRPFNSTKTISQKPLVPNIIEASAHSIPQTLLNQFSYPINFNSLSNSSKNSKSPISLNPKDLICNSTDDAQTLIQKNKRLIQLVVQSSNKIAELNENRKRLEEQHNLEKQDWLMKLEKITDNYKTYAESYQNYTLMKEELEKLHKDIHQTSQIMKHYENLLKLSLNDFLSSFKKINFYLVSEKMNTSVDLSKDYFLKTRDELKEKIIFYNDKIDKFCFEEIFEEIEYLKGNFKRENPKNFMSSGVKPQQEKELKSSPVNNKISNSPSKKGRAEMFTKKENYNQTRHVRQRSCDVNDNKTSYIENELKMKRLNESNQDLKNIGNEVNYNTDKMHQNYHNNQRGNNYEENNKEMNENSEYTPQFINPDEKQKITATALYDFVPQRKTELGFKRGDIIEIEIIKDNGWWQGCLNGERGLIPYNYIRINE